MGWSTDFSKAPKSELLGEKQTLVLLATVKHGPAIGVVYEHDDGSHIAIAGGYHGFEWTHWAPLLPLPTKG